MRVAEAGRCVERSFLLACKNEFDVRLRYNYVERGMISMRTSVLDVLFDVKVEALEKRLLQTKYCFFGVSNASNGVD